MKTSFPKVSRFSLAIVFGAAGFAFGANAGNPASVNMRIYGLYVSPNADCTSPVQVFSNPGAVPQNMLASPDLGSGAVPNGTYHCVIIKMSDQVSGTAGYSSDLGHCVAGGALAAQDVCRGGQSSTAIDGTNINCGPGDDTVFAYFSTAPGGDQSCLMRAGRCTLAAPLVVTGGRVGTFVANFDGQIVDQYGECGINPPVFSFR